ARQGGADHHRLPPGRHDEDAWADGLVADPASARAVEPGLEALGDPRTMSSPVPLEQLAKKKVLVTGGAGFVGSNIVRRLVELQADVTVLDHFVTGDTNNLAGVSGPRLVKGSVTDAVLLSDLVPRMNVVIHAAARNIIVSTRNPREDFETNIGGTLNILMA